MSQVLLRTLLRGVLRHALKPVLGPRVPVAVQRRVADSFALLSPRPTRTRRQPQRWGDVPGESWQPLQAKTQACVLFLHGGGYCIGSPASHGALGAALSAACGAEVAMPHYRRAPEHPCPAALEDVLQVYRALRAAAPGRRIVLAGDSAGAGLALSLAVAIRDAGLPAPAGLLLLSPWADMSCSTGSRVTRAARDPMLSPVGLMRWGAAYAGARPLQDPLCSPLFANLDGLPPTLIQVGTEEILFDDAERLHGALRAADVAVELQVFPGMWHDFQLHVGMLDTADDALQRMAAFVAVRAQPEAASVRGTAQRRRRKAAPV